MSRGFPHLCRRADRRSICKAFEGGNGVAAFLGLPQWSDAFMALDAPVFVLRRPLDWLGSHCSCSYFVTPVLSRKDAWNDLHAFSETTRVCNTFQIKREMKETV